MIYMVVPCYNEEKRLDVSYWSHILERIPKDSCCFSFVDDGSTDDTTRLLQHLADKYSIKLISLNNNVGKANAIRHSFELLSEKGQYGDVYGFIDSDSAFSAEEVVERISSVKQDIKNSDAVFMSRIKISGTQIVRSTKRHILSRIIYTYLARDWEWAPYDTQCGFKFFLFSDNLHQSLKGKFATSWFFDIELVVRLSSLAGNRIFIKEIPLQFWTEREGSKLRGKELIRIFVEIIRIRSKIRKITHL